MRPEDAAINLYQDLIAGWNAGDTDAIGAVLTAHSLVVGFDRSQVVGRDSVVRELGNHGRQERGPDRVAHRVDERWVVALFQTTPAQLHGRPDEQEALTAELSALL